MKERNEYTNYDSRHKTKPARILCPRCKAKIRLSKNRKEFKCQYCHSELDGRGKPITYTGYLCAG